MYFCQKDADKYDVIVSTADEIDFGRPGIQYVHYPYMRAHLTDLHRVEDMGRAARFRGMLRGKVRPWLVTSGIRLSRLRKHLMVTNSHWTAQRIREAYQVDADVLYPPVRWVHSGREWSRRQPAFAMLGRISPCKRPLEIIDILERVRARGHDVRLEIIGGEDAVAGKRFIRTLRERTAKAGGWARLHVGINRDELESVVSTCRYGIHGMLDEHFGIAVGELVRAGCIVFVPNSGGQVEIVGREPMLCYGSSDDAVDKICQVLANPAEQSRLLAGLREQTRLFTEEHFMQGMCELVKDFAARTTPA
jgi:glycosyltransferase involved in cell wall biosynthesis